jgi:hypothetical protein
MGGYCFYRTPEWGVEEANAPDTLAALESLQLLGLVVPSPEVTGNWLRARQADDGGYPTLMIGWAALRALHVLGPDPDRSPAGWLRSWTPVVLGSEGERQWRGALVNALRLLELWRLVDSELEVGGRGALARLLATAARWTGGAVGAAGGPSGDHGACAAADPPRRPSSRRRGCQRRVPARLRGRNARLAACTGLSHHVRSSVVGRSRDRSRIGTVASIPAGDC